MLVKKLKLKITQFTLLIVFFNSLYVGAQESWALVDKTNQRVVDVSANYIEFKQPRKLLLKNSKDTYEAEGLLAKYYWLLKNGKIQDAINLYSTDDNSKSRIEKMLVDKKINLSRFVNLSSAYIIDKFEWGEKIYFTVKFVSNNDLSLNWNQTVTCKNKQCYLNFDLLSQNGDAKIVDVVKRSFWEYGNTIRSLNFKSLRKDFEFYFMPSDNSVKNKANPIKIVMSIDLYDKPIELTSSVCELKNKRFVIELCKLINTVKAKSLNDRVVLDSLYANYWGGNNPTNIRVNQLKKNISSVYSPEAFLWFIKKWISINVIGTFDSNNSLFVLYSPKVKISDGLFKVMPVQLLVIDKEKFKIDFKGNNEIFHELFYFLPIGEKL